MARSPRPCGAVTVLHGATFACTLTRGHRRGHRHICEGDDETLRPAVYWGDDEPATSSGPFVAYRQLGRMIPLPGGGSRYSTFPPDSPLTPQQAADVADELAAEQRRAEAIQAGSLADALRRIAELEGPT